MGMGRAGDCWFVGPITTAASTDTHSQNRCSPETVLKPAGCSLMVGYTLHRVKRRVISSIPSFFRSPRQIEHVRHRELAGMTTHLSFLMKALGRHKTTGFSCKPTPRTSTPFDNQARSRNGNRTSPDLRWGMIAWSWRCRQPLQVHLLVPVQRKAAAFISRAPLPQARPRLFIWP